MNRHLAFLSRFSVGDEVLVVDNLFGKAPPRLGKVSGSTRKNGLVYQLEDGHWSRPEDLVLLPSRLKKIVDDEALSIAKTSPALASLTIERRPDLYLAALRDYHDTGLQQDVAGARDAILARLRTLAAVARQRKEDREIAVRAGYAVRQDASAPNVWQVIDPDGAVKETQLDEDAAWDAARSCAAGSVMTALDITDDDWENLLHADRLEAVDRALRGPSP